MCTQTTTGYSVTGTLRIMFISDFSWEGKRNLYKVSQYENQVLFCPGLVIHPQCFPKVRFLFSCLFPHVREALWDGRVSECSCCYTVPVHGMLEGNMAWFSTAQGNAEHAGLWQHIWVWVELTADTWFPCQAPFVPVKLIWVVTTCAGKVFLQSRRMRLGILSEDVWNVPRYTRVSDWKYVPIYWAFRKAGLTQTPLQVVQGRELLKGPPNGVDLAWVRHSSPLTPTLPPPWQSTACSESLGCR